MSKIAVPPFQSVIQEVSVHLHRVSQKKIKSNERQEFKKSIDYRLNSDNKVIQIKSGKFGKKVDVGISLFAFGQISNHLVPTIHCLFAPPLERNWKIYFF